tara:strand:- start:344 stop:1129 length:786 start_codon:yes stop_codon:yes gene_type:complete
MVGSKELWRYKMAEERKFPTEVVDLPSRGKLYPSDSPISNGKIEIKYMTAKEEDILTSQNLIKKGLVIDKLLDSLIITEGISLEDLIIGDKNAIMVASRILAYGPEYPVEITDPDTGELFTHTFNLADCPFKETPDDIKSNDFEFQLPVSKTKIDFKLLTGKDEISITKELESMNKINPLVSKEITTRLRHVIKSIDGNTEQSTINQFVENMLARDSLALRNEIARISPDIELVQEVERGGKTVTVGIPMTVNFFWPSTTT